MPQAQITGFKAGAAHIPRREPGHDRQLAKNPEDRDKIKAKHDFFSDLLRQVAQAKPPLQAVPELGPIANSLDDPQTLRVHSKTTGRAQGEAHRFRYLSRAEYHGLAANICRGIDLARLVDGFFSARSNNRKLKPQAFEPREKKEAPS